MPSRKPNSLYGGAGCAVNVEFRARTGFTQTSSDNLTLSLTISRSITKRRDLEDIAAPSGGILHTSVVTVVSIAVVTYGSSGAAMMQRMQAQQLLNDCGGAIAAGADFSSSPTQMHFGPDGANGDASYVRGTVVGNLLLWLSICIVLTCAVKILQLRGKAQNRREGEGALSMPGLIYIPYSMLLVPTVMASTTSVFSDGQLNSTRDKLQHRQALPARIEQRGNVYSFQLVLHPRCVEQLFHCVKLEHLWNRVSVCGGRNEHHGQQQLCV